MGFGAENDGFMLLASMYGQTHAAEAKHVV